MPPPAKRRHGAGSKPRSSGPPQDQGRAPPAEGEPKRELTEEEKAERDRLRAEKKAKKAEERIVKDRERKLQFHRAVQYLGFQTDALAPPSEKFDGILIAIDVESYERNHKIVTELGFATLDMRDLTFTRTGSPPDQEQIFNKIVARHFRIREYMHMENRDFVQGCADKFEFGTSEIISRDSARSAIAGCMEPPYFDPARLSYNEPTAEPREVILVGHGPHNDINYFRNLGYDVLSLPNLIEVLDTAEMFRALTDEVNTRGLAHVLFHMDIIGWNLHNAGNDAVYTLQAMIAMCLKGTEKGLPQPTAPVTAPVAASGVLVRSMGTLLIDFEDQESGGVELAGGGEADLAGLE